MKYFTQEYIDFFTKLAKNNKKEWFDENKKIYQKQVKEPFEAFADEMVQRVKEVDPNIAMESGKEGIFRINKDVRFSKDKTPYKTYMAGIVTRTGRKDMEYPGIYFQFGADGIAIAGGLHMVEKENLQKVRTAIAARPKEFAKIVADKTFIKTCGGLQGEKNKIVPKEFKEAAEAEPSIANKQFYYMTEYADHDQLLKSNLVDFVMKHYTASTALTNFLRDALQG